MANANSPRGLQPYADSTARYFTGGGTVYYVPPSDANNIFVGDPVIASGLADANGVPAVTLATAGSGNYLTGAMIGLVDNAGALVVPVLQNSPVYRQANVGAYILVADDPDLMFWVQEDSVGGALPAGAASGNADLVAGTGSTVTGFSGWQLQSSSEGTGATLQLRILRALQEPDNAIGTNAKWLVKINLHTLRNATGV